SAEVGDRLHVARLLEFLPRLRAAQARHEAAPRLPRLAYVAEDNRVVVSREHNEAELDHLFEQRTRLVARQRAAVREQCRERTGDVEEPNEGHLAWRRLGNRSQGLTWRSRDTPLVKLPIVGNRNQVREARRTVRTIVRGLALWVARRRASPSARAPRRCRAHGPRPSARPARTSRACSRSS